MSDPLASALDLLRRLPPSKISSNLETLINLCPELAEELISSVDQPSLVKTDSTKEGAGREYLACDYNRDGDSYRSPWSNAYEPPLDDGTVPPPKLRDLEVKANDAFNTYRQLYYDGGLSSVYLWELDGSGFAGVVLFKKELDGGGSGPGTSGCWDSLHVFEVSERGGGRSASYNLTSTVMLSLGRKEAGSGTSGELGTLDLAGSLTRQTNGDHSVADAQSHIANMGRMVEDMEAKIRNSLQEVYFGKTKDIVGQLRSPDSLERQRQAKDLQKELMNLWKK
ncbi:F-actin capping protein beta subunit [Acaromyces ingoldii]|uniref:F-actin-capping protein subunit beta n=1 Tax=Acaromyces ingoldii TaxID=215250 RepID=A0A316Z057_9BASI|nr:F-actin capping protein beta subunit [Acaromyces ingoldii]PWN94308.1 F-actin capping protein beta subunit [Acaromyces ingoldii]